MEHSQKKQTEFLLCVKLDDEGFLNRCRQILANRKPFDNALKLIIFNINLLRDAPAHHCIEGVADGLHLAAFFFDFHHIADLHLIGRNVNLAAIYNKMVVSDQMATLIPGIDESHSVNHIVEPSLQGDQHIGTGNPFLARSALEEYAKLLFREAIKPLDFLLFPQLNAVVGCFATPPLGAVARRITPSIKRAFVGIAAIAF